MKVLVMIFIGLIGLRASAIETVHWTPSQTRRLLDQIEADGKIEKLKSVLSPEIMQELDNYQSLDDSEVSNESQATVPTPVMFIATIATFRVPAEVVRAVHIGTSQEMVTSIPNDAFDLDNANSADSFFREAVRAILSVVDDRVHVGENVKATAINPNYFDLQNKQ